MNYGNITLNDCSLKELKSGICSCCLEEAEEICYDESFSDEFGLVRDCSVSSSCCSSEVYDGKIWLDKTTEQVAKKDHFIDGKLIVAKGQRYLKRIRKGWFVNPLLNEKTGIFKVDKWIPKTHRQFTV